VNWQRSAGAGQCRISDCAPIDHSPKNTTGHLELDSGPGKGKVSARCRVAGRIKSDPWSAAPVRGWTALTQGWVYPSAMRRSKLRR